MNKDSIVKTLSNISFLSGLAPDYVERIADIAQSRSFNKNEVMFDEGQYADNFYFIVSGNVLLEVYTTTTGCKHIITVGKGEVLGWSSMTDQRQYTARAVALDPLQVVEVDGAKLRALCDADPRFGYEFLRRTMIALAKRLTATWKQLAELYVSHYVTMPVGASAQND